MMTEDLHATPSITGYDAKIDFHVAVRKKVKIIVDLRRLNENVNQDF